MTYLPLQSGDILVLEWVLLEREWHCRIRGERLTNCGKDFSLFHPIKEELTQNDIECAKCERVIKMILSARASE